MIFNEEKPIYVQIADRLCDEILADKYMENAPVPATREYAALLQVNNNTAMKAYASLAEDDIIYNKRGSGYFVSEGAKYKISEMRKKDFIDRMLPDMFRNMQYLGITLDDVEKAWKKYEGDSEK